MKKYVIRRLKCLAPKQKPMLTEGWIKTLTEAIREQTRIVAGQNRMLDQLIYGREGYDNRPFGY